MSVLEELQESVARVMDRAGRSVVGIGQGRGLGSGFVVSEGRVLTNAHNVRGPHVSVVLPDGRTQTGDVAGLETGRDLAVILADTDGAVPLEWARQEAALRVGSPVFAAANPGGRGLRVTFGLVSATARAFRGPTGRPIKGSIEHTAPLARGSSGGPLLDAEGRLLGVNTNRLGDGFYLAMPADDSLRERMDALSRGESRESPRLGIGIVPSGAARSLRRAVGLPDRDGLLVRAVEEGAPAAHAGLAEGDMIVEAQGQQVTSVDDLYDALERMGDGPLELTVLRGSEERPVSISLG